MKEFFIQKCENAFSPVPNWVQRLASLTMGAKLTYGRLLQCANDEGVAWPSQRYLSKELGCSLRSIVTYIGELKKHDLIAVSKTYIGDYPRTVYRFVVPDDQRSIPEPKEFTPSILDDDADIFFCTDAGTYLYATPSTQISSAPASEQGLHENSAVECKPCAGVSNSCVEGTQRLRRGYATPALSYNDDKNKILEQRKNNTPHIPPRSKEHSFPNKAQQPTFGEKASSFSPTFPYSPRNDSTPTSLKDGRGKITSCPASPLPEKLTSDFEAIWDIFPLKQGKIPAQTRWNQLVRQKKLPELSVILNSIKEHIATDNRWQRGIIPNLERWLREHRWTDQPFADPAAREKELTEARKQELELQAAKELMSLREAIKGYPTPITDPVTVELIDSHGGLSTLSRMPERNLPYILNSFVKNYTQLSLKKGLEEVHV
ncbi:helix-turn-helix domain-containing protein [Halodesulfovibrio aestuarii]|uniref:Helix-turn-helix domain-containing protein n=1 Tax=Halodesulfovibrio aestuarii TaxID=126333 RepID=A0A8G2F7R2_9BACT|nr:helix-turn-helix domain-containing protein [Halodesulfovibrio aestuarii]SHJ07124.1 Helix-turn-helix domain-containing protein [Halodesulfovibrio aestuarii]